VRSITGIVRQFRQNWTEELGPLNIERACPDCGMNWLQSMLNPVTTIRIFVLQILHGNTACTDLSHLAKMAFTATGYCKARMRIKPEVLQLLLQRCVSALHEPTLETGRWLGHRIFMVDGSSFSMSDTAELHSRQPGSL
jgi:hypothetical protein